MDEIQVGEKIVVFNGSREELGEGTFIRTVYHPELNLFAYECEEHTILARGTHYVKRGQVTHTVEG